MMSLIAVFFSIGVVATMGEITDFFPDAKNNLTKISWDHAVNNQSLLTKALNSSVMMLEADVVLGKLSNDSSTEVIPIMAHPPADTSDLSLQNFLNQIYEHNNNNASSTKKGVKLDFKSIEAFSNSTKLLSDLYSNITFPLWLNADILSGPVNATTTPVDATQFLALSKGFPNAALSIGWTTNYGANFSSSPYTDAQIKEMLETIRNNNVSQTVTFPVRAGIAAESLDNMKLLLSNVSGSTLTIWSSENDKVNVTNLKELIKSVGVNKVYVDVPEELEKELHLDTLTSSSVTQFSCSSLLVLALAVLLTKVIL